MVQLSAPNNAILIVCTPVFNLLTRIEQDKLSVNIVLYQDFVQAFHSLDRLAQANFIANEELAHIRTCLAMLCDDIMQHYQTLRPTSAAQRWPNSHLQLTLLGIENGDAVFFNHLDKLLKNAKNNLHLIELYYVCLALGFRDESRSRVQLLRLKVRVYQEIIRIRGHEERALSLNCQQEHIRITKAAEPVSLLVILICTVILFAIGFFTIEYILRAEIEAHFYYIKEQAQLLISVVSEGRQ